MQDVYATYVDHDEVSKDEARKVIALLIALKLPPEDVIETAKKVEAYLKGE